MGRAVASCGAWLCTGDRPIRNKASSKLSSPVEPPKANDFETRADVKDLDVCGPSFALGTRCSAILLGWGRMGGTCFSVYSDRGGGATTRGLGPLPALPPQLKCS